ncbi:hypothetical protein QWY85_10200 [Neolewinella lacunae]|uniref:Uncharacterized protein n=1 Tax=Neolewinella lacunae TaxID=1517758 RepID=A0A923PJY2_9BACT|nr:hypothetical protein [Neolewinella lacunae]MBC6995445.1 hypothetical protein [Neolewinella lacunae]MDN3635032.1 hypothetical protein [Neolewinella lacunae]
MNLLRYYKDDGSLVEVSLAEVEAWLLDPNKKNELADFIFSRLYYRYIKPFEFRSKSVIKNKTSGKNVNEYSLLYKNGFSVMANCCLLIETLETFLRGWENSSNKSEAAFLKFFSRDKNFKEFAVDDMPTIFYKSIRCGILHQGETTNGWRITRDERKLILDTNSKEINASKFLGQLKQSITDYKDELLKADWNDEIWKMARNKLKSIVKISKS